MKSMRKSPDSAETAGREGLVDRDSLRACVRRVQRRGYQMLYEQRIDRLDLMVDLAHVVERVRLAGLGAGGRVKGDGAGPEGAD